MKKTFKKSQRKTRARIQAIEKRCLDIGSSRRCDEYRISSSKLSTCDNCKINKKFKDLVGLGMDEVNRKW